MGFISYFFVCDNNVTPSQLFLRHRELKKCFEKPKYLPRRFIYTLLYGFYPVSI